MFISENIPSNFNRIAELSDNYVVLVKEQQLLSGHTYEAYIQYFSPSTQILHLNNYKIVDGDTYTLDYHYINNQYYSYIDYVSVDYTKNTYELDRSTDFWDRGDILFLIPAVIYLLLLIILIVNLATSLVHRGGIFHA